jgi:hypothetical protein
MDFHTTREQEFQTLVTCEQLCGGVSFDNKNYSSTFSHANEKASAGYYAVKPISII